MDEHGKERLLERLSTDGKCWVKVGGWSMWPFICNGDEVCLVKLSEKIKFGQVVGVFNGNQLIVHRIVRFRRVGNSREVKIRGDFQVEMSLWIPLTQIAGKVEKIHGKWPKWINFAIFPGSWLALALSPITRFWLKKRGN